MVLENHLNHKSCGVRGICFGSPSTRARTIASLLGVILVGVLLLGALFSAGAAAQNQDIGELNVTAETATIDAGETATLNVTVSNEGNQTVSDIGVAASNAPSNWTVTNATIDRLGSNESTVVMLNATSSNETGSGTFELNITAEGRANISDTTTTEITIRPETTPTPTPGETPAPPEPTVTPTETPNSTGGGGFVAASSCDRIPLLDICWSSLFDLWPF